MSFIDWSLGRLKFDFLLLAIYYFNQNARTTVFYFKTWHESYSSDFFQDKKFLSRSSDVECWYLILLMKCFV